MVQCTISCTLPVAHSKSLSAQNEPSSFLFTCRPSLPPTSAVKEPPWKFSGNPGPVQHVCSCVSLCSTCKQNTEGSPVKPRILTAVSGTEPVFTRRWFFPGVWFSRVCTPLLRACHPEPDKQQVNLCGGSDEQGIYSSSTHCGNPKRCEWSRGVSHTYLVRYVVIPSGPVVLYAEQLRREGGWKPLGTHFTWVLTYWSALWVLPSRGVGLASLGFGWHQHPKGSDLMGGQGDRNWLVLGYLDSACSVIVIIFYSSCLKWDLRCNKD